MQPVHKNAENRTRGRWARSKNATHCVMQPPSFKYSVSSPLIKALCTFLLYSISGNILRAID